MYMAAAASRQEEHGRAHQAGGPTPPPPSAWSRHHECWGPRLAEVLLSARTGPKAAHRRLIAAPVLDTSSAAHRALSVSSGWAQQYGPRLLTWCPEARDLAIKRVCMTHNQPTAISLGWKGGDSQCASPPLFSSAEELYCDLDFKRLPVIRGYKGCPIDLFFRRWVPRWIFLLQF